MKKLERLLQDYVAGDLDRARRAEIEALLERDADARALHDEIAEAHAALTALRERPEPPVGARDALPAIQVAIATHQFEPKPKLYMDGSGRRFYQRLALAATLLLAVTVGLFAWNRGEPTPATPEPRPSAEERGILPAEDLGGMDGLAYLEHLKKRGLKEIRVTHPGGVLPVVEGAAEKR